MLTVFLCLDLLYHHAWPSLSLLFLDNVHLNFIYKLSFEYKRMILYIVMNIIR